jgi:hypothetical protein
MDAQSTEFEIDGKTYRIGKLSAFEQFHLSRKIAPLIPPLIPVFIGLQKAGSLTGDLSQMPALLQPFADSLASMSDASAEAVLNTCLSVVSRKADVGDSFVRIWHKDKKVFMFQDLNSMETTIPLVIRVIQDSLGPFIQGLLSPPNTASPQEASN